MKRLAHEYDSEEEYTTTEEVTDDDETAGNPAATACGMGKDQALVDAPKRGPVAAASGPAERPTSRASGVLPFGDFADAIV